MKIHEYQAKEILRQFGVPLSPGLIADTPIQARQMAQQLGGNVFAIKAQIHAGGRGKGGGVKIAKSLDEVEQYAQQILGMMLITPQTSSTGQHVKKVYIEQGCQIAQELYLSLLLDREQGCLTFVASTEGGMDIEEVAHTHPEKIVKYLIDSRYGLQSFQARDIAFNLNLKDKTALKMAAVIGGLYKVFMATDASLIEINPLVITTEGNPIVLDAKMTFDENALFRHPAIAALRDPDEEDPTELEAQKHELNYVKLDGNIGCMVNGAGLAMATMDVIKLYDGEPANFLDVGGGATRERATKAFKLILSDTNVKGILVNIFGGIMRCDIIAEGIIAAARDINLRVPLVVRLEGTNVKLGQQLLQQSGLPIITAHELGEAAQRIVQAVKERQS